MILALLVSQSEESSLIFHLRVDFCMDSSQDSSPKILFTNTTTSIQGLTFIVLGYSAMETSRGEQS